MQNAIKAFGIAVLLFLFSFIQSCTELTLSMSGTETNGIVGDTLMEVYEGSEEPTGKFIVKYSFRAEYQGRNHTFPGSFHLRDESEAELWHERHGQPLAIIYDADHPNTHRVVEARSMFWVYVFGFFCVVILACGGWLWIEARGDVERSRR